MGMMHVFDMHGHALEVMSLMKLLEGVQLDHGWLSVVMNEE